MVFYLMINQFNKKSEESDNYFDTSIDTKDREGFGGNVSTDKETLLNVVENNNDSEEEIVPLEKNELLEFVKQKETSTQEVPAPSKEDLLKNLK